MNYHHPSFLLQSTAYLFLHIPSVVNPLGFNPASLFRNPDIMSREEARFNLDISSDTAKQVQERGRDSQKSRGVLPSSGNLDEMKLAGPVEEELMTKAGRESQKRKEEKK
ncbi:hypothetical protein EYB26_002366 [Talaromyces marneffei]|nr:uncharacterized protein EYB26_002366 [Talaromyces marneffei]QGA14710.1 hypothetical protein EYB26_002366 [Talaromyces marneffei]